MFRRGIFRRFNKHLKGDVALHEKIQNGDPEWVGYEEILQWVFSTETVYQNKH